MGPTKRKIRVLYARASFSEKIWTHFCTFRFVWDTKSIFSHEIFDRICNSSSQCQDDYSPRCMWLLYFWIWQCQSTTTVAGFWWWECHFLSRHPRSVSIWWCRLWYSLQCSDITLLYFYSIKSLQSHCCYRRRVRFYCRVGTILLPQYYGSISLRFLSWWHRKWEPHLWHFPTCVSEKLIGIMLFDYGPDTF